jgi:hypothetical protein
MNIDFTQSIRKYVGPKLAFYGFKFDEGRSFPTTGKYEFTRNYWGKLQYVIISRVSYTVEDVESLSTADDDALMEVPREHLLEQEPNFRLWLSNKYLSVLVGQEYGGIEITRGGLGDFTSLKQATNQDFDKSIQGYREFQKKHQWWEFHSESDLKAVLSRILEIITTEGLDWFEEQVADIRRYHEKLDARRIARKRASKN